MLTFNRVRFKRFKAFSEFTLDIRKMNILVGPNNAGKSTVLSAFRILTAGLRRAKNRNAVLVPGLLGESLGYNIDISSISVAEENIFYNYDDSLPAQIIFDLSKKVKISLIFPEIDVCSMFLEVDGAELTTAAAFKRHINVDIGFVPILGPVEQREPLFEKPAAQAALYNYRAARNFRNIWYHFPANFERFRAEIVRTWPGMDIQPPERHHSDNRFYLAMYCLEKRISRELCWSGFGFQVWCQMLTHLIASGKVSLFLIDEPDIYLHSELQRQLISILRQSDSDILIATHSTEIVSEAESDELVIINKEKKIARRIRKSTDVSDLLSVLGSNLNPTLTQLAKTRRVLFVEGRDFDIIGRYAQKLGESGVANRRDFAVIPVKGFAPEKIRNLIEGIESALGSKIIAAAILDRDYRCDEECVAVSEAFVGICHSFTILERKEIENFLLVPQAIERAAARKSSDRAIRTGSDMRPVPDISGIIEIFCHERQHYVSAQLLDFRKRFERSRGSHMHDAVIFEKEAQQFTNKWRSKEEKISIIPGKEAINYINAALQTENMGLTPFAIIDSMRAEEIPQGICQLILLLKEFSSSLSPE